MTVTLEEIKAAHAKMSEMIAAFEKQPAMPTTLLTVPEAQIELAPGERYAGVVLDGDGSIRHHLILLPGEAESVSWDSAVAWAREVGGELPTRQEQALLYANLKLHFKQDWYWSGEQHEDDGSYAWGQYFDIGDQGISLKSYDGRAIAVRRFVD